MFTDDTKIIHVIKSRADFLMLQNDLDSLFNWSKLWQLNFNISKCKLMRFGYSNQYGTYTLGDTKIDSVESHKDLGILFDNCLKIPSAYHISCSKHQPYTWPNQKIIP